MGGGRGTDEVCLYSRKARPCWTGVPEEGVAGCDEVGEGGGEDEEGEEDADDVEDGGGAGDGFVGVGVGVRREVVSFGSAVGGFFFGCGPGAEGRGHGGVGGDGMKLHGDGGGEV